jgi:hypothetical protein
VLFKELELTQKKIKWADVDLALLRVSIHGDMIIDLYETQKF